MSATATPASRSKTHLSSSPEGDSSSGLLYGDGESIIVFLFVAPDAASCYTTNDGEEP